jgi:hypothetical protein
LRTNPEEVPEPKKYELLSGKQFNRIIKKEGVNCFVLFLDSQRSSGPLSEESRECSNIEIVKEFSDVFPEELPKILPPERSVDHHIDLISGSKPFSRAPYRLSKFETDEVEKLVHELLSHGHIQPSKSPWAAPVLFARKKDGKLRFCVDYRALNKQTVRIFFPIPTLMFLLTRPKAPGS